MMSGQLFNSLDEGDDSGYNFKKTRATTRATLIQYLKYIIVSCRQSVNPVTCKKW
jgi:hypothetical protein